jgi:hypothetical protein
LAGDDRGRAVQIDVAPAQPGRLAAAQAAQRDQVVDGIQPVLFDRGEELSGLLRGPHCDRGPFAGPPPLLDPEGRPHHRTGPTGPGQLGMGGRVLADQPAADRRVQRGPQRGPDPGQRRGRDRRPQGVVLTDDRGEHRLHLSR